MSASKKIPSCSLATGLIPISKSPYSCLFSCWSSQCLLCLSCSSFLSVQMLCKASMATCSISSRLEIWVVPLRLALRQPILRQRLTFHSSAQQVSLMWKRRPRATRNPYMTLAWFLVIARYSITVKTRRLLIQMSARNIWTQLCSNLKLRLLVKTNAPVVLTTWNRMLTFKRPGSTKKCAWVVFLPCLFKSAAPFLLKMSPQDSLKDFYTRVFASLSL